MPAHDAGTILNNIGSVYAEMGQYGKALAYQQQALALFQSAGGEADIAAAYHNLGYVYAEQNDHQAAIEAFERAIAIRNRLDDRFGVAETRNNLGLALSDRQNHQQALTVLASALEVLQQLGTRKPIGATYDSIGSVSARSGDFAAAFNAYLQALAIWRETDDRDNARITLGNIGALFERSGQPALAIAFYKQSVNISERIRNDLKALPEQDQKAYLARVQGFYRSLADLLLRLDRVIEAQQVLDLLKVQEAADFLGPVRGNQTTGQGVAELPAEQDILKNYAALERQAITTGQALAAWTSSTAPAGARSSDNNGRNWIGNNAVCKEPSPISSTATTSAPWSASSAGRRAARCRRWPNCGRCRTIWPAWEADGIALPVGVAGPFGNRAGQCIQSAVACLGAGEA